MNPLLLNGIKSGFPYLVAAAVCFGSGWKLQGINTQRAINELEGMKVHQARLRNEAVAARLAVIKQQQETLDELRKREAQLPAIRAGAVDAYLRRMHKQPGDHGNLPAGGTGNGANDGEAEKCVPDREFIENAADDAANLADWQRYCELNKLPVAD